jgi:hypothetical protein
MEKKTRRFFGSSQSIQRIFWSVSIDFILLLYVILIVQKKMSRKQINKGKQWENSCLDNCLALPFVTANKASRSSLSIWCWRHRPQKIASCNCKYFPVNLRASERGQNYKSWHNLQETSCIWSQICSRIASQLQAYMCWNNTHTHTHTHFKSFLFILATWWIAACI